MWRRLIKCSEGQAPYCATYKYASGSQGYGCAAAKGYSKTVLTTTTPDVTPFGQAGSLTSSTSSGVPVTSPQATLLSTSSPVLTTPATTTAPASKTPISGGTLAGAVAGAVVGLAAVVVILLLFLRRHQHKKQQERQATNCCSGQTSRPFSERLVYAQYAKPSPTFASPPQSPPLHTRHPSDQSYMCGTSPPQSELGGQYFSPESFSPGLEPAELECRDSTKSGQHH